MKPGHSLIKHYLQFKDLREQEYAYLFERTRIIKSRFKNYERYQPLVEANAVSKQDADNSESAVTIANAEILAAKAALATAELNLGYATVTAPISGRIGKAEVTEGAPGRPQKRSVTTPFPAAAAVDAVEVTPAPPAAMPACWPYPVPTTPPCRR